MHLIVVIWLIVLGPRKGIFSATKTLAILIFMFCVERFGNSYCFIYLKYLVVFVISTNSSTPNVLSMMVMMKLDETNYQKWKKTLVMNMIFMKLDVVLEIDPLEKLTGDSSVTVKKLYEDRKHSNKCCMMMMDQCIVCWHSGYIFFLIL